MDIKTAIKLAELWDAGKMIGGDEDAVISALLKELKEAEELLKHATDVIDKLSYISGGIMIVSIVDEEKLSNVLNLISEKKDELKEIYGDESVLNKVGGFFSNAWSDITGEEEEKEKIKTSTTTEKSEPDLDKQSFYQNITEIKSILYELKDIIDSPSNSHGSFDS